MPNLTPQHLLTIRSYLRHLSRFPDAITRAYLLNLLHQRCRRPHGSTPEKVQKRIEKTRYFIESVRLKIAAANSGHVNIFAELLKEAFARTGKRREEFMKSYAETAAPISEDPPYPASQFPTYPPALVALLTSPEAYPGRGRPTTKQLQSIPPNTLITNTWSDLPPDSQKLEPPKSGHMGMLHEARQINHRRWLYDRWLAGLTGPPLSAPPELEKCLPPKLIELSQAMISEIEHQTSKIGPPGVPRFSPLLDRKPQAIKNQPVNQIKPPIIRIPARMTPTHPLSPRPVEEDFDPLKELLPKRQRSQGSSPPSVLDLSRGPRRVTQRLIRRRYQNLRAEIPILVDDVNPDWPNPPPKKSELVLDPSDGKFVDRSWITPAFDRAGPAHAYSVRKLGPGLGEIKASEMSDEDLLWMPK